VLILEVNTVHWFGILGNTHKCKSKKNVSLRGGTTKQSVSLPRMPIPKYIRFNYVKSYRGNCAKNNRLLRRTSSQRHVFFGGELWY
jgi:hypothetical protein